MSAPEKINRPNNLIDMAAYAGRAALLFLVDVGAAIGRANLPPEAGLRRIGWQAMQQNSKPDKDKA